MSQICFKKEELQIYSFLLIGIIVFLIYIYIRSNTKESMESMSNVQLYTTLTNNELLNKIKTLQEDLFDCTTSKQACERNLQELSINKISESRGTENKFFDRIYNPLVPPERTYNKRSRNYIDTYQQIGIVYNDAERYPLFARPKYPGKTDKYEYYLIDETRNRLKIPFRSKNDNELFDGDTIFIDILKDSFTIKIYDYDNVRYNPDIF